MSTSSRPRSTSSRRRSRPTRRDRKRPDPARLCDDHRADRRPRRLPPGRCRQYRARHRSQSAHGADADQPACGHVHAAECDLGAIREAMLHGPVTVLAFDQDNDKQLSRGPAAADRQPDRPGDQHDPAQGRRSPTRTKRLWPGEFVQCAHPGRDPPERRHHSARPPCSAGPSGLYTWVVSRTARWSSVRSRPCRSTN